jgi:hypothetical protein
VDGELTAPDRCPRSLRTTLGRRDSAVSESEYWKLLEFRVSRELRQMPERSRRYLWCDGFVPEQYVFSGSSPRIVGCAWIGNGPTQERWRFTLFIHGSVESAMALNWDALLPADDVTEWLAVDEGAKQLQIDPAAARPDAG